MKMGKFGKPQQGTLATIIVKDVIPAPGAATKKTWIWKVEMRASLVLPEVCNTCLWQHGGFLARTEPITIYIRVPSMRE